MIDERHEKQARNQNMQGKKKSDWARNSTNFLKTPD
jgi:hypothetical protein